MSQEAFTHSKIHGLEAHEFVKERIGLHGEYVRKQ